MRIVHLVFTVVVVVVENGQFSEFARRPSEAHFPALVNEKPRALASSAVISTKKTDNSLSYAAATSSKLADEKTAEKKVSFFSRFLKN